MSILNLGLQCVGLMCQEMDVELEEIMSKCNSMNDIRKMAEKTSSLKEELDIDILWNSMLQLDPSTLTKNNRNWANIKNKPISNFFNHCCRSRSYFFSIKKCGKDDCEICLPIRSPQDIFNTLDHLPDPVPANNEHYKNFSDVYHMDTEDEKKIFMAHLDTVCYTCGTTFSQNDNGFKMELEDDFLEESS
ncbi:hypothetical protein RhiirA5_407139 [Rhizophagus irregularis]|uniref:Uncharacterized protein n=1 Tax=Rhizophagus irregularis TaxID=588596 RepID=A0A2N0QB68_9GLOM|nr:hypothetical protein RhiirA5_407139 [Rhizophagus irregularis]